MGHTPFDFDMCLKRLQHNNDQDRREEQETFYSYLHGIVGDENSNGMLKHFIDSYKEIIGLEGKDQLIFAWQPITHKIVRRLAFQYISAPQRVLIGQDDKEIDEGMQEYRDWITEEMVNLKLRDAQRITKLARAALLQTRWDHVAQRVRLDLIPPHLCIVESDPMDPMRLIAYGKFIPWTDEKGWPCTAIEMWTKDTWEIRVFDGAPGELSQARKVAGDTNPIGRLPVVVLRDQISHHFWGEPRASIIQANLFSNFLMTQLGESAAFQSFGIGVAVNLKLESQNTEEQDGQSVRAVRVSPKTVLAADGVREGDAQPTLTFAQPNNQMPAIQSSADWVLKMSGVMEGLGPNVLNSEATEESGKAIALKGIELSEERTADKEFCLAAERDLLELWNAWNKATWQGNADDPARFPAKTIVGPSTPEEATLIVNFDDSMLQPDPASVFDVEQRQIQMGLLSKVDYLMRQDPELTEDAAIEKLQQIAKHNSTASVPAVVDDLFDDDDEEEEEEGI